MLGEIKKQNLMTILRLNICYVVLRKLMNLFPVDFKAANHFLLAQIFDRKTFLLDPFAIFLGTAIVHALTAHPSKIVAGQEPEKTNEFLQALRKVCLKKVISKHNLH